MGRPVILTGRVAALTLAVAITLLSVVPRDLRRVTDMPHDFEHLAILPATGVAFGFGYSRRALTVAATLFLFAGMVEVAQVDSTVLLLDPHDEMQKPQQAGSPCHRQGEAETYDNRGP
jgi:hypothetical protein